MTRLIISIIFLTILYNLVYLIDFVKNNKYLKDMESIRKEILLCIGTSIFDIVYITIPLWGKVTIPEGIWKSLYLLAMIAYIPWKHDLSWTLFYSIRYIIMTILVIESGAYQFLLNGIVSLTKIKQISESSPSILFVLNLIILLIIIIRCIRKNKNESN